MPYTFTQLKNPDGIVTTFNDVITDDVLLKACSDRIASEDTLKGLLYILDDFTNVTEFKVTSEGIQNAAKCALAASRINSQAKLIVVAPTDLLYGMARMWDVYANETGWEKNIARSREEADQWIKENI